MVKMQHTAHCIHSLSERAGFEPLWKRFAGVAHVLFGVITRAQMLQPSHDDQECDALKQFDTGVTGFTRLRSTAFLGQRTMREPNEQCSSNLHGARNPALSSTSRCQLITRDAAKLAVTRTQTTHS